MTTRKAALLATGFFAMAVLTLSGSQCSQVSDRSVGPSTDNSLAGSGSVAACVQACNDIARDARRAERDLHKANVDACDGNEECLAEEEARHEARMDEINYEMQACKAPCHEQGGGTGGQ